MRFILILGIAGTLASALPEIRAAPIIPPLYRSGIDLITNGGTVSRALTCWKDKVYVSVDAQDCHAGAALSSATVYEVDARNPRNLLYTTKSSEGGCKANGLVVFEDKLYVANWSALLRTFDLSNAGQVRQLAEFYVPGDFGWTLSVARDRVYLGEAHELAESFYIIDVANPANPRLVSATDWAGSPAVWGSYSFYSEGTQLKVLNISDESAPVVAAGFEMGMNLGEPQLQGNRAYASWTIGPYDNGTSGVVCIDISEPLAPRELGRWSTPDFYYFGGLFLLGDFAYLPTGGNGVFQINIANPSNMFSVAQFEVPYYALELAVAGNGRYIYAGTVEGERDAGVHCWQVSTEDPDDAAPGDWRNFQPRETSWTAQFEGEALPTAANPRWSLFEGTERWGSVSNGVLRVNDTGTVQGDKVKWSRNWQTTSSRGATVLTRARCATYNTGGAFIPNLVLEDGRHTEEFAILSDKIRAHFAEVEFALDGTQWHTYRITTRSNRFDVYVDEAATPVLSGPLSTATTRARVIFGSGSSPARQDIYFDYVHAFDQGAEGPSALVYDRTPDVSVRVSDLPGKGSLSLLATNTARVHWSCDGGTTWSSSGGAQWNGQYEGDALPSSATPAWHPVEGTETWGSVTGGVLRVNDTSTAGNTKLKYERHWRADPVIGATVLACVRCASARGDTTYSANLFIEDGQREESFKILPDRVVARNAGLTYRHDGTVFHVYRVTVKGGQFKLYVDENPTPVMSGTLVSQSTENRVMFGSGASAGTQDVYFDYVRYSVAGELPPGHGEPGGPVLANVLLEPGAVGGVDRCTIRAQNLPVNQFSTTLNKVRFSIADVEGNVGWSPIYTVRTVMVDLDGDHLDDSWERGFFGNLSRDGTADFDGDAQSDYEEFVAGTNPCDRDDLFRILGLSVTNQLCRLSWTSVAGKTYAIHGSAGLSNAPWWQLFPGSVVATGAVSEWTGQKQSISNFLRVEVLRP